MSTALVVSLNQAAINGIRTAGAKQVINVEGNGKWYISISIASMSSL
jgi:hypothetical protein